MLQRHPDVFANLIRTLQAEADSVVQDEEVDDNEQDAEVEVVIEVARPYFYAFRKLFNLLNS